MNADDKEDNMHYNVVVNHEGQYSILAGRARESRRLDQRWKERVQGRMPWSHQRSVDGHETAVAEEKHGEA